MTSTMETPRKKRFRFACLQADQPRGIGSDDKGDDVRALQSFLTMTGHLGKLATPGEMCGSTMAALKAFQECYRLNPTGLGDPETLRLIEAPRCGVADVLVAERTIAPAAFETVGCKYPHTNLTYAVLNHSPDLPAQRQSEIIAQAFKAWADVSALNFREVTADDDPNFTIAWQRGNHGDGHPFDDEGTVAGNTLAHAYFPPTCGGLHAGAMHFDEFESWSDTAAEGQIRLLNVAIHEIGHLLGLAHSDSRSAIMYALYSDHVDRLSQDDIDGVRHLYGPPTP